MAMARWLLLACCSALFVLQGALVQGADQCVLDGFDLGELNSARYWNVTLRREECVVPKNYTVRDVTGCTVHFSICKPLPREICVNQTNSSTCEVVTTSDGKIHYFNIGTSNPDLQPTGGNDDIGFATIRQGNANDSALCNSTFITIMTFKCEPTSIWDHKRNDATVFTRSRVNFETCILELSFNYSGACYIAPTLAPDRCRLDPYDLSGLQQMDYWSVALLNNQTCLIPDANPCIVYFSFCQGLPLSIGEGCYEAAVCQAGMTSEGDVSHSMGRLNETAQFFKDQVDFIGGGFFIEVEGGDTICTSTDKRASTRIVLICDPMAIWNDRNLSGSARVTQMNCEYTITIPYAGACLPPAPSTSAPILTSTPTQTTPSSTAQPTRSTSVNSTVIPQPTVTSSSMMTSSVPTPMPTNSPTSGPTNPPTTGPTTGPPTGPTTGPTTQKKPPTQPTANPDRSKIAGLTAGLVIFMLIALALLVLFIIAVYYIYKSRRTGEYERLQDGDKM